MWVFSVVEAGLSQLQVESQLFFSYYNSGCNWDFLFCKQCRNRVFSSCKSGCNWDFFSNYNMVPSEIFWIVWWLHTASNWDFCQCTVTSIVHLRPLRLGAQIAAWLNTIYGRELHVLCIWGSITHDTWCKIHTHCVQLSNIMAFTQVSSHTSFNFLSVH